MKKLHVLVINVNGLKYTKDCMNDLLGQDSTDFEITLFDQNSSEPGTLEYLKDLAKSVPNLTIVRNNQNSPVNYVWNWFAERAENELLCFLNNDVRITKNFVSDTIAVMDGNDNVGVVCHATNHPDYKKKLDVTTFFVMDENKYMQGWDYTIRSKCFKKIPEFLKTYCGDDFLFGDVYESGYKMAYVTSSPLIHYEGKSKGQMKTSGIEDTIAFKNRGFKHHLRPNPTYSKIKPTFQEFDK